MSAAPATYHMQIRRGTTAARVLHLVDADNAPINLTGYEPRAQARLRAGAPLAFALPFVIDNAPGGQVSLTLTPEATSALPSGRFVWDFVLFHTATSAIYGPFIVGDVLVQDAITQPPA